MTLAVVYLRVPTPRGLSDQLLRALRFLRAYKRYTVLHQVAVARDVQSAVGGTTTAQVGASAQLHIGDDATATVGGTTVVSAQKMRFDSADSISAVAGHDLTASAKDQMTFSTAGVPVICRCACGDFLLTCAHFVIVVQVP
jgi:hypothetical protein|eukprot:COSAG02_NODE_9660_length_2149_cov_6.189947_4_plen_141_part_00